MAPQPGRSAAADTAAVLMADERADGHPKEVRQADGAVGIYGMVFVQNREILGAFPGPRDDRIDTSYRPAYEPGRLSWRTVCHPGFLERH
jgi:hypothetical protein